MWYKATWNLLQREKYRFAKDNSKIQKRRAQQWQY